MGRTGHEKTPRAPVAVDTRLARGQELRHALHLVHDDRAPEPGDEPIRIRARRGERRTVVEREVEDSSNPSVASAFARVLLRAWRAPTSSVTGESPTDASSSCLRRRSSMAVLPISG